MTFPVGANETAVSESAAEFDLRRPQGLAPATAIGLTGKLRPDGTFRAYATLTFRHNRRTYKTKSFTMIGGSGKSWVVPLDPGAALRLFFPSKRPLPCDELLASFARGCHETSSESRSSGRWTRGDGRVVPGAACGWNPRRAEQNEAVWGYHLPGERALLLR